MPLTTDDPQVERLQSALGLQYRIERELGRGGMGIVYLARDLTLDRLVAVKVVHPQLSSNRSIADRFLAEARTVARLRHPNIVTVHSAGEVDGQLYYVMDFLPGETLRQRLSRQGRQPPAIVVRIAADIAAALDTASRAGVVHRDLKPENILLEGPPEAPCALLTDFGIARLVERGSTHTGPGAVMGTPAYMSPEQASGETVDGRSDLYSLGVVAYEMLAGAPPFNGPHRVVISKQILDRPEPLDAVRPDAEPDLTSAVMRALAKTPDERWQSGREFRRALLGEAQVTPPESRQPGRRKAVRWLVAAAAAAVVGVGAFFGLTRQQGPPDGVDPRQSLVILPFDNLRQDTSVDWLRDGSINMLTLALSQWRDLTVVDQHRVQDLLDGVGHREGEPIGLDLAQRVARAGGAWTVVLGDFSRTTDSLYLVARTYDVASGRRLEVIQVEGESDGDVRLLFDQLAARLLDLSGAPLEGRAPLASVTTGSVEAYRAYLRGADALNHWRLAEASAALERATAIDSSFALAHYRLAVVRGWMSPADTLGMVSIRRASRASERLPERERGLIEAYRTFIEGDFQRSIDLYRSLVTRDSSDIEAWYGLADASFHGGYNRRDLPRLSHSLRAFRRVVSIDSGYSLAYEHMGQLLTDAANPVGWFLLSGPDSLVQASGLDAEAKHGARAAALAEAIRSAQDWIRAQPGTPRAHYHLYKALLTGRRATEARQVVNQLRTLYPDSLRSVFGFFDARAQLVAGDLLGAARTVRQVLPQASAGAFAALDYGSDVRAEVMSGASALAYHGDLEGAVEVIRLTRDINLALDQAIDSVARAGEAEAWELGRLAELLSGVGAAPARLRAVWDRGARLARLGRPEEQAYRARAVASAAVGVFLAPGADTTLLHDLRTITGRPLPPPVEGLVALRRGDTAQARESLASNDTTATAKDMSASYGWGDLRPLRAEAYFQLGDYAMVVQVLREFEPDGFATRGFDARWGTLPRVRLLRAAALEQLGQPALAAAEYRAVVEQWVQADQELLPVVQRARAGLARIAGLSG